MHRPSVLGALAAFTATTTAFNFTISTLTLDQRLIAPNIQLNFTVSAPGTVFEQGGPNPAQCNVILPGPEVPTCWNTCSGGSGKYYARIPAGGYASASHFTLDIWQAYVYELGNHNNATFTISTNDTVAGYSCTQGGEDVVCQTASDGEGFNATLVAFYGGADPPGDELCVE